MPDFKTLKGPKGFGGFTLVEIIIVVVILGIAAMIAVPMFSGAADMQVRAAANRIAADLDYAKGLAITHQKPYSVVFYASSEAYDIRDTTSDTVVDNPLRSGFAYTINLATDSNFDQVDIVNADFDSDGTDAITFDYLGSPYHGKTADSANALNSGRVTLQAGNFTIYVDVEPMTGYVTIAGP
ncbi:MAG: prepilin-type N-terminal cleavage/methylation domain-containing protein [Phycisphaerae bacterium]|nr:prepilin-type N-terminal cleavage/methylation domain-containing protein [Phycisphaerae bacterium]